MCVLISGTLLMCMGFIFIFNLKEVTRNFTLLLLKRIQDLLAVPVGLCGCFLLPEAEKRNKCYLLCGTNWERKLEGKSNGQSCSGRMTALDPAAGPFSAVCFALQSQRRIQNMTACSESKAIAPRLYKHRELNV